MIPNVIREVPQTLKEKLLQAYNAAANISHKTSLISTILFGAKPCECGGTINPVDENSVEVIIEMISEELDQIHKELDDIKTRLD